MRKVSGKAERENEAKPTILAEAVSWDSCNAARRRVLVSPALVDLAEPAADLGAVNQHLHRAVAARPAVGGPGTAGVR